MVILTLTTRRVVSNVCTVLYFLRMCVGSLVILSDRLVDIKEQNTYIRQILQIPVCSLILGMMTNAIPRRAIACHMEKNACSLTHFR